MLLLERDINKKRQVDEMTSKLEFDEVGNGIEYKIEGICDNAVYARELEGHLTELLLTGFVEMLPRRKNTWEPALIMQYLQKFISIFHKEHLDKPIATSTLVNSVPLMARPIVKLEVSITKQKCGRPAKANDANKCAKRS